MGVEANENVNVDKYEAIGQKLIDKMIGELAVAYSFKRKEKTKTLADSSCIDVDSDRKIDSTLPLLRMLVASKSGDVSMTEVLDHELCLFSQHFLMQIVF